MTERCPLSSIGEVAESAKASNDPVEYPTDRLSPFDPPPVLSQIATDSGPICRLVYPDGHVGWLVTGADVARDILSDDRFSARSELKRAPVLRPSAAPFIGKPALPGWFVDMDRPEHTRIRRTVSERLSLRSIRKMTPRIEAIINLQLDLMAKRETPVDLISAFALPVPTLVICELLGVPYERHTEFQKASRSLFSLTASAAEAADAMHQLEGLIREILKTKRHSGADDLLGQMAHDHNLSEDEAVGLSVLLLTAGHETVAGTIGLSAFFAIQRPDVRKVFTSQPDSISGVVEELLRYLTIFHHGVPRTALEQLVIRDHLIQVGDSVTVALPAVNRDPASFDKPHLFDLQRSPNKHLAFGYGIHQCSGQHLARLELQIALAKLFQRFPTLRLTVAEPEVPLSHAGFHGVETLPVTW
ncbi:cytochrome P450 [Agrobacterium cavarae]|uniref:Cytochrome P450 n=2 Tax=Agrobacterium cavarae TaxID=2528239 RepID=A0ABY1YD53_9HYPH|nr:cytochrome P450 [Agrobacterium cavarae]